MRIPSFLLATSALFGLSAALSPHAMAQHAGHQHAQPTPTATPTPAPMHHPPMRPGMVMPTAQPGPVATPSPAMPTPQPSPMAMPAEPGHEMPSMAPESAPVHMDALAGSGTSWHPASSPMTMTDWQAGAWTLMARGRAQLGYNHQGSLRGMDSVAAPNWGMLMAERPGGPGRLGLSGMFSPEPATFPPGGLPQLLQTGETYLNQPILDHQHPHNLVMELAARYTLPLNGDWSAFVYGGPVGEPALGPEAFMHRASAGENPWAPLVHHLTDSTHITDGVLTGGLVYRNWKLDASVFNAREPGENRWIVTPGPLDSYSGRLTYNPTPNWSMQVSTGHLTTPEALSAFDTVRTTASVTYNRPWDDGNWATTLLWGKNVELAATPEVRNGYLAETAFDWASVNHLYSRAELVDKSGLASGVDVQSLGAFTLGGVRDVWQTDKLALGVGGDVTLDVIPQPLQAAYGSATPLSFQVYVRLAPPAMSGMGM